jgi:predicted N-acyltransferase
MQTLQLTFSHSIAAIGADTWNALTGTENPFTRYEFLWGLESTGCTTQATGWQPYHILVQSTDSGETVPVAVMPLYLKTHSYGEYVFDWSWANAYQTHGYRYYPKFVTAIPFTPSRGSRYFIKPGVDPGPVIALIMERIEAEAERRRGSSWHVLFPTPEQHEHLATAGLLRRRGCQFHWYNKDYQDFEHFLSGLNSRKRKNIRKERQQVADAGITFDRIEGADIDPTRWHRFYDFYQSTYRMRGMEGYLNEEFFAYLTTHMPEQVFMNVARLDGKDIAAALFFKNASTLYGRYWGSQLDYRFLHFETCYYQGQDYAIKHGLRAFDSGAQGEHKIQRGFEPIVTYSNHWIKDPGFAAAIEKFLAEEEAHIDQYKQSAASYLPFRQS